MKCRRCSTSKGRRRRHGWLVVVVVVTNSGVWGEFLRSDIWNSTSCTTAVLQVEVLYNTFYINNSTELGVGGRLVIFLHKAVQTKITTRDMIFRVEKSNFDI
jgi:hypothetical protein